MSVLAKFVFSCHTEHPLGPKYILFVSHIVYIHKTHHFWIVVSYLLEHFGCYEIVALGHDMSSAVGEAVIRIKCPWL